MNRVVPIFSLLITALLALTAISATTSSPAAAKDPKPTPTVTLDQTTNVTDQVVSVRWENFTPSTGTGLTPNVEFPVAIYQCEGTKVTKRAQCIGTFEHLRANDINRISEGNQMYATTRRDGTGEAQIAVRTKASDPQLDCDFQNPCSIVVEPAVGGLPGDCDNHLLDDIMGYNMLKGLQADSPDMYACSWPQRIVVPISFAPTVADCPQADASFNVEGSPMLQRAMQQWGGGVCKGADGADPVRIGSVDVDEYSARLRFTFDTTSKDPSLPLTSVPMAEGSVRKHTYAPLGVSAVAVAYVVDDQRTGTQMTDLVLNARLLAKMLTQSYASGIGCPSNTYACDKGVTGNPDSVFEDPEFQKLNPDYRPAHFGAGTGDSFPIVVGDNSDMTYELTRWIASDPQGAAFLQGYADPWGMTINPCYLEEVQANCGGAPPYPISQFTNNSDATAEVRKDYGSSSCGQDKCYALNGGMQYTWTPVHGVAEVARTMAANQVTAKELAANCGHDETLFDGNECRQHPSSAPQNLGNRAIFAIMPLADAEAYAFPTAKLVTSSGSAVAATPESMTTALGEMTTNPDGITQKQNYRKLIDPKAYPLTMVDYAAIPTCDVSTSMATDVAGFLDYIASSERAQTSGRSPGMLAPGYVPLTGAQTKQVANAAKAIRNAGPCDPPPTQTPPPAPTGPSTDAPSADPPTATDNPPTTEPTLRPTAPQDTGPAAPPPADQNDSDPNTVGPSTEASDGPVIGNEEAKPGSNRPPEPDSPTGEAGPATEASELDKVAFGTPQPDESPLSGVVLPIALLVGGALLIGGPALYLLGRTGVGPVIAARIRGLVKRG